MRQIAGAALGLILAALAPPAAAEATPHGADGFALHDMAEVALGQLLFYDPILSGNRATSCATCHHPRHATSDGVSLGLGDGATGLGPERRADADDPPEQRVPRNSPALFNLGHESFTTLFHDGRLMADPSRPSGLRTPLEAEMVEGFASALAAQTMFPVLSPDEMAGHYSENEISRAVRQGLITGEGGAWALISARVAGVPAYRAAFDAALGPGAPIRFTDISNMLSAFIATEWRADASPYDAWRRGEAPLPAAAERGRRLFEGVAGCAACHAGPFQTDHGFHAIAMPQIGPGKAARFESHAQDTGRMRVTGNPADAYAFRTPSLRNVAQTAPYGHAGAYATLEGVIRHHLDPPAALAAYDPAQAILPALPGADDLRTHSDPAERAAIAAANALPTRALSDAQIADLTAFLHALTDPASLQGRLGIPDAVPSGLPLDR